MTVTGPPDDYTTQLKAGFARMMERGSPCMLCGAVTETTCTEGHRAVGCLRAAEPFANPDDDDEL